MLSATLPGVPAADTFNLVPGSDQVAPLLPEGPVEPGDSWSRDVTVPAPFGADDGIHASLVATLVRYQPFHGVRAAVIEEHGSIPLDLTLDVAKVLQALGKQEPQLPSGVNPQIRYHGTVTEEDTSWFDPAEGRVLSFSSTATVDATISFTGMPAGATAPDFGLSGKVSIDLRPPAHHTAGTGRTKQVVTTSPSGRPPVPGGGHPIPRSDRQPLGGRRLRWRPFSARTREVV